MTKLTNDPSSQSRWPNWPVACALMFGGLLLVAYPAIMLPAIGLGAVAVLLDRANRRKAQLAREAHALAARADAQNVALQREILARPTPYPNPRPPSRARRVQGSAIVRRGSLPTVARCDAPTKPLRTRRS